MSTFPILYVDDVERTARFYEETFGFERTYEWKEDGRVVYAAHKRGDSRLAFGEGQVVAASSTASTTTTCTRPARAYSSWVLARSRRRRTCRGASGWPTSTTSTATGCT